MVEDSFQFQGDRRSDISIYTCMLMKIAGTETITRKAHVNASCVTRCYRLLGIVCMRTPAEGNDRVNHKWYVSRITEDKTMVLRHTLLIESEIMNDTAFPL